MQPTAPTQPRFLDHVTASGRAHNSGVKSCEQILRVKSCIATLLDSACASPKQCHDTAGRSLCLFLLLIVATRYFFVSRVGFLLPNP